MSELKADVTITYSTINIELNCHKKYFYALF